SLVYSLQVESRDVHTAELNPESGTLVGKPLRLAKRFAGGNSQPLWSPDGTSLAYQAYRQGIDDHPSIVIHDRKSGRERVFAPELSSFVLTHWLPDSGLLLRIDRGGNRFQFSKMDARTGELMSGPPPLLPSPDGKWTVSRNGGSIVIHTV